MYYSGTSNADTIGTTYMYSVHVSEFQGLPVEFPVGVATHTQAVQHDMATFLELRLVVCW